MQIYINKINTLTLCILLLFSSNFTQTSSTNVEQMSEEETCKTAEDCFILATFYEQTNRREFAKSAYSDSIRLKPNFAEAYFARGKIYASVTLLGSSETYSKSAIADFTKFIRLRPKSPLGYAYRGLTYKDGDEYQLALADFDTTSGLMTWKTFQEFRTMKSLPRLYTLIVEVLCGRGQWRRA